MPYKESNNSKQTCSFCQRSRKDVAKLVVSQDVSICNICVEMVHDLLHKDLDDTEVKSKKASLKIPSPTDLKELLDERVIGQEQAKQAGDPKPLLTTQGLEEGDQGFHTAK